MWGRARRLGMHITPPGPSLLPDVLQFGAIAVQTRPNPTPRDSTRRSAAGLSRRDPVSSIGVLRRQDALREPHPREWPLVVQVGRVGPVNVLSVPDQAVAARPQTHGAA